MSGDLLWLFAVPIILAEGYMLWRFLGWLMPLLEEWTAAMVEQRRRDSELRRLSRDRDYEETLRELLCGDHENKN